MIPEGFVLMGLVTSGCARQPFAAPSNSLERRVCLGKRLAQTQSE